MNTYIYGFTEGHYGDANFKWIVVEQSATTGVAGMGAATTQATAARTHGGTIVFRYWIPKPI